jgi:hypothetical protein
MSIYIIYFHSDSLGILIDTLSWELWTRFTWDVMQQFLVALKQKTGPDAVRIAALSISQHPHFLRLKLLYPSSGRRRQS